MIALGAFLFWPIAWALGCVLLPSRAILPRSRWEEFSVAYLLGSALICVLGTVGVATGIPFAAIHAMTLAGGAAAAVLLFM
ncbi:MAG: hypothetical protein O3A20_03995, partial [Planctomycetota bacterium]|nr:hypothetical protein [Planctomycetota bacterium]